MQCEKEIYEPTYCSNMETEPAVDLHRVAQIQEERLEFKFREIKDELAEENQSERQELMELRAQMLSKCMDDETEVKTRIQEHEQQEERKV